MIADRIRPILLCAAFMLSYALVANAQPAPAPRPPAEKRVETVISKDGTKIAYEKVGSGPALVVVGGALSGRAGGADLATLLAPRFTVYTYDRRGRGQSGDTQPYAVQREVEDLEALIDKAGGSAHVYGKSSGAALAIHAAASLPGKVKKLALYEAPYDDALGAAKAWKDFRAKFDAHLAAGRRAEAVTAFLTFVGTPEKALADLKASPAWPGMLAMAPTIAYDNAILGDRRSVPVAVASKVTAITLVMDGGASAQATPFMRATAEKLGRSIPNAGRHTIPGQDHNVDAKALAPVLVRFFEG